MKKVLCLLVLTTITGIHSAQIMTPPATPPPSDWNQPAIAFFRQTSVPAIPENKTVQMREMDAKCMTHPEIAAKHMEMLNKAYEAGHIEGYQKGIKLTGQYIQSCLNGVANVLTTSQKTTTK